MAYDKVIDSAVLDANLESVANAIRTKGGTTANLAFPTGFVNAISAIETGGNAVVRTITVASDITNTPWTATAIISGDEFIKKHYNDSGFSAMLIPVSPSAISAKAVHFIYHGNAQIGATDSVRYGVMLVSNGSVVANLVATVKVNGEGYNVCFRVDSSGALKVYVNSTYVLKAGTYKILLSCQT